ncbi:hypothetical protein A3A39_04335 [Candidatus Kaiserbacteria bacterium RIFCSPLOWO2_01_FULL_54_13]|uniref:Haloacid dehalogenase n=1 Tax=Candidatus Kaiserbacteria bacterium RIFCSPLOWO2_01_FULL_54_13 TaxID=1798512 RepID=A0A1F6F3H2_9BACT|nr:MAG: hypothetical protein A3A39_04335 [Candidatus Kaiserbacteria bacterium RIFCSPLOWO2_01_FULL_54_13]
MQQFDGVAFDLEGPIVNTEPLRFRAQREAARAAGVELTLQLALERVPSLIGGAISNRAREIWALSDGRILPEEIERLETEYFERALENADLKIRAGFPAVLKKFRDAGLRVSIGTSAVPWLAHLYIERTGLTALFEPQEIVIGDEMGCRHKPYPDVPFETARVMGIKPTRQLVFEDSVAGILAAIAAHSSVIAIPTVRDDQFTLKLLAAGARLVVFEWAELDVSSII